MKCDVVVDLQYGSTAKGKVCQYLASKRNYDASIRVQSIQAGHTVFYNGVAYKMRTIPCAWTNPSVLLILGPGAFIDKDLLLAEIKMIEDAGLDVKGRLYLDYRATYIIPEDFLAEKEEKLGEKIGSTLEGAGASLIRKIWRKAKPSRVCDDNWANENGLMVYDTVELIQNMSVLLEGCQGTLLSVHTSPYYPFCTSRECTVSGILSEAGISPFDVKNVHGVFRTLPIRVGGNSGGTSGVELTWEQVAKMSGNPTLIPERTTVTNRQRRIFQFSVKDIQHSIMLNKPNQFYLTFIDYINFKDYGLKDAHLLSEKSNNFINFVEKSIGRRIDWISTGVEPDNFIEFNY